MGQSLQNLYGEWENWSALADKSENGWQSDFPAWGKLISSASAAMLGQGLALPLLRYVEACWIISEESQDLADFAEAHVDDCWEALVFLAASPFSDVRWQVYLVLAAAGNRAEPLLRIGIEDPHPYCKRRALLSLSRLGPSDADQLARRFINDADPSIRQVAVELIRLSSDDEFIREMRDILLDDEVDFVRRAARGLART